VPFIFPEHTIRIETDRFGPFTFQLGIDFPSLETLFLRVSDAHERFRDSPLAQVANRLEKEVIATSVYGTNSIEGGTLSEEETQLALDLNPADIQDVEQRRAVNIKAAYGLSRQAATNPDGCLDLDFICNIHRAITENIPHERNKPGLLRDNDKHIITHVGDQAHGGRYKPPQYGHDIRLLLDQLLAWNQQLKKQGIPALIRAPLVHYYYELIHPFWDGNGRVGRVIEATLLQAEGYRYAPFAQAGYYFDNIDDYFTLFNTCRKSKSIDHSNTPFVQFFLEGMLTSLNKLHARVNKLVNMILFENDIKHRHDDKQINARQYAIVSQILATGKPLPLAQLQRAPWYQALYLKLTNKTRQRDLRHLRDEGIITVDKKNQLWPGFVQAD